MLPVYPATQALVYKLTALVHVAPLVHGWLAQLSITGQHTQSYYYYT
jgi:hypothetical protein